MNDKETQYAAQLFGKQCKGDKLTASERTFLQDLLDGMNAAESAGCIAAIIRIMLNEGKAGL